MRLTIEDGENTIVSDVHHVSITDTERIAVVWWNYSKGLGGTYEPREPKPRRIVLEFGDDAFPASVNYGQRTEE